MIDVKDDLVTLGIGIDAGLAGKVWFSMFTARTEGGGRYLGTIAVTEALYPKTAVVKFKPTSGMSLDKLEARRVTQEGRSRPAAEKDSK